MKTVFKLLTLVVFCFFSIQCYSQDTITKNDGTDIQAKIIEVTPKEIKFKKFDNQTGPTFTLLISDLVMVRYENGTRDIFNQNDTNSISTESNDKYDLIEKGKQDAIMNYNGQKSGKGGTAATTIFFGPVIGLIPAAIISSSEPEPENLRAPDAELMRNPSYNRGYTDQAFKTKKKKVWKAFGIASGVWVGLIVAAYAVD